MNGYLCSREYCLWKQASDLVFAYAEATKNNYTPARFKTHLRLAHRSARRYQALQALMTQELEKTP